MDRNIRQIRRDREMTLIKAAGLLNTDPGNLSRIERGKQQPSIELARRIADLFGMTLDDVFKTSSPRGVIDAESDAA